MTRDEVLKAVGIAAEEASAAAVGLKCTGQGRAFTWYSKQADLLRAAAELIRQSGWRPIAEAPENRAVIVGRWWLGKWCWKYTPFVKTAADDDYTYYVLLPEPPALEVERGE